MDGTHECNLFRFAGQLFFWAFFGRYAGWRGISGTLE
jgi:hypothetical protein